MKKHTSLKIGFVMILSATLFGMLALSVINAGAFFSHDEYYDEGDVITFRVQHKIGIFYQDTMNVYPSFIIEDTLPEGLEYVSAAVTDSTGADLAGYGTLTFDEVSGKVSFVMGSEWLSDESHYKGQTITLTITTKVLSPVSSSAERNNTGYIRIGDLIYASNTVTFYSVRPELTVTKSSDKEKYKTGEEIKYSVTAAQTTDRTVAKDVVITDAGLPSGVAIDMESVTVSDVTATIEKNDNEVTVRVPELDNTAPLIITYTAKSMVPGLTESEVGNTVTATGKTINGYDVSASDEYIVDIRNTIETEIENGSITETVSDIEIGEDREISFTPDEGYYVQKIIIDGEEMDADAHMGSYIFENIVESHDIKVICSLIPELSVVKYASKPKVVAGEKILYTVEIENIKEGASAEHIVMADQFMASGKINIKTVSCDREHVIKETDGGFGISLNDSLDYGDKVTVTYFAETGRMQNTAVTNTAYVTADGMAEPVSVGCETCVEKGEVMSGDGFHPVLYLIAILFALAAAAAATVFGLPGKERRDKR